MMRPGSEGLTASVFPNLDLFADIERGAREAGAEASSDEGEDSIVRASGSMAFIGVRHASTLPEGSSNLGGRRPRRGQQRDLTSSPAPEPWKNETVQPATAASTTWQRGRHASQLLQFCRCLLLHLRFSEVRASSGPRISAADSTQQGTGNLETFGGPRGPSASSGATTSDAAASADMEIWLMVVAIVVSWADVGLDIAVVQMLWRNDSLVPAGLATAFICLPVAASACALVAALRARHWHTIKHSLMACCQSSSGSSPKHSQGTAAYGGKPLSTTRAGDAVHMGGISAVLSAMVVAFARESWSSRDLKQKAKGGAQQQQGRQRMLAFMTGLLPGLARAVMLPLLLPAGVLLVLLLDASVIVGLGLLVVRKMRAAQPLELRPSLVAAEVVLRQHRACRSPLQSLLESLPMAVLQAVLLGIHAHGTALLSVSLAFSVLALLAGYLELSWGALLGEVRLRPALVMCLQYRGSCLPPPSWAEWTAAARQQLQLSLMEPGFSELHRLQKIRLLSAALAGRPRLIVTNSQPAGVIATMAAAATAKLLHTPAAAEQQQQQRATPRGSPKLRQVQLLCTSCESMRRLAALLPAAQLLLPALPVPQLQQQQDVIVSLVAFEEGLAHGAWQHVSSLLELLLPMDTLTTLVIKDTRVHPDCIQVLCQSLMQPSCHLHTLVLSETGMAPTSLASLCTALASNSSVHSLDLGCTRVGPGGAGSLGEMLASNGGLREMVLSYAGMGSADAGEVLAGASLSRSLLRLDLSQNHLRDDVPLLQQLGQHGQQRGQQRGPLQQLDLSFNWIQENPAGWLLLALELFPSLTHLNLNHNNFSSQPGTPMNLSRQTSSTSAMTNVMTSRQGTGISSSALAMRSLDAAEQMARDRGLAFLVHLLMFPDAASGTLMRRISSLKVLDMRGLKLPVWFTSPGSTARPACFLVDAPPRPEQELEELEQQQRQEQQLLREMQQLVQQRLTRLSEEMEQQASPRVASGSSIEGTQQQLQRQQRQQQSLLEIQEEAALLEEASASGKGDSGPLQAKQQQQLLQGSSSIVPQLQELERKLQAPVPEGGSAGFSNSSIYDVSQDAQGAASAAAAVQCSPVSSDALYARLFQGPQPSSEPLPLLHMPAAAAAAAARQLLGNSAPLQQLGTEASSHLGWQAATRSARASRKVIIPASASDGLSRSFLTVADMPASPLTAAASRGQQHAWSVWEAVWKLHPEVGLPRRWQQSLSLPGAVLDTTDRSWRRLPRGQQVSALYLFFSCQSHILLTNISKQVRKKLEEELCNSLPDAQLQQQQQQQPWPLSDSRAEPWQQQDQQQQPQQHYGYNLVAAVAPAAAAAMAAAARSGRLSAAGSGDVPSVGPDLGAPSGNKRGGGSGDGAARIIIASLEASGLPDFAAAEEAGVGPSSAMAGHASDTGAGTSRRPVPGKTSSATDLFAEAVGPSSDHAGSTMHGSGSLKFWNTVDSQHLSNSSKSNAFDSSSMSLMLSTEAEYPTVPMHNPGFLNPVYTDQGSLLGLGVSGQSQPAGKVARDRRKSVSEAAVGAVAAAGGPGPSGLWATSSPSRQNVLPPERSNENGLFFEGFELASAPALDMGASAASSDPPTRQRVLDRSRSQTTHRLANSTGPAEMLAKRSMSPRLLHLPWQHTSVKQQVAAKQAHGASVNIPSPTWPDFSSQEGSPSRKAEVAVPAPAASTAARQVPSSSSTVQSPTGSRHTGWQKQISLPLPQVPRHGQLSIPGSSDASRSRLSGNQARRHFSRNHSSNSSGFARRRSVSAFGASPRSSNHQLLLSGAGTSGNTFRYGMGMGIGRAVAVLYGSQAGREHSDQTEQSDRTDEHDHSFGGGDLGDMLRSSTTAAGSPPQNMDSSYGFAPGDVRASLSRQQQQQQDAPHHIPGFILGTAPAALLGQQLAYGHNPRAEEARSEGLPHEPLTTPAEIELQQQQQQQPPHPQLQRQFGKRLLAGSPRAVLLLGSAENGPALMLQPRMLELPLLAAVRQAQAAAAAAAAAAEGCTDWRATGVQPQVAGREAREAQEVEQELDMAAAHVAYVNMVAGMPTGTQQQQEQQLQATAQLAGLPVVEVLFRGLSDAQVHQLDGLLELVKQLQQQQGLQPEVEYF